MLLNYSLKLILRIPKHDNCVSTRKWCSEVPVKEPLKRRSRTFQIYKQLIMDKMQLSSRNAIEVLEKNNYIFDVPVKKIIKISKICQYHNMHLRCVNGAYLELFQLSPAEVKTRILILKEMGVRYLVPIMLNSTNQLVNLKLFKVYANIDKTLDIAEKLYSYLHEPPPEVPPLEELDDNVSIRTFRIHCLSHYIKWRLNIPPNNKNLLNRVTFNLRNQNFSKLRKSFDVLHDEIGMSIETIRDRNCLEHCSPEDLKLILARIETIGGVSLSELIKINPLLSRMRYVNVSVAKKLLEKHKYTREQIINGSKILLSSRKELLDISELMNKRMELKIFHNHPKIFEVYLLKDELDLRMDYLNYLKFTNASVSMLKKCTSDFDKVTKAGKLVYNINEINWIIEQHLSIDVVEIRKSLCKHPFWNKISLFSIYDSLQFLTTHFDQGAIKKHLHLVLYSKEKLAQVLMEIVDTYGICSPKNPYTTSQIMALCDYELEKNYHFTGDGVWDNGVNISNVRPSLRLSFILNDLNNRINLFKNNPDDHFYSYMNNNNNFDIKINENEINTGLNNITEIDDNIELDDNIEIDITDGDINIDTSFQNNNRAVICNDYDYYNEMYNDEFDDDSDDELQFDRSNKT